jgi:hypothetical protein
MIYNNFAKNKRSKKFLNISILAMLWKLNYTYIQVTGKRTRLNRKKNLPTLHKIKRAVSLPQPTQNSTFDFARYTKPVQHPHIVENLIGLFLSISFLFLNLDIF